MFELPSLVKGLTRIICDEHSPVVHFVDLELWYFQFVITTAFSERQGMGSESLCCVQDILQ